MKRLLLCSLFFVLSGLAAAQTPAVAAESLPAEVAAPSERADDPGELLPIDEADVPVRAESSAVALRRLANLVRSSAEVDAEAIRSLQQHEAEIADLTRELDSFELGAASLRGLDDRRREWRQLADRLRRHRAVADAHWQSLQAEHRDLLDDRLIWNLTRDSASAGGTSAPVEIQSRIGRFGADSRNPRLGGTRATAAPALRPWALEGPRERRCRSPFAATGRRAPHAANAVDSALRDPGRVHQSASCC